MRRYLVVASLVLLAIPANSLAATSTVTVAPGNERIYDPRTVNQKAAGTVVWEKAVTGSKHSVTSDNGMFSGHTASAGSYTVKKVFSAGTFGYHCTEHGSDGMVGTIAVKPAVKAAPTGANFTVVWAASTKQTGSKFDVQYRIGSGAWKNWKKGTTATKAVFGASSKPVKVSSTKKYSFRVVSKSGAKASGMSPVASFSP